MRLLVVWLFFVVLGPGLMAAGVFCGFLVGEASIMTIVGGGAAGAALRL